jgi:hypothetical protein
MKPVTFALTVAVATSSCFSSALASAPNEIEAMLKKFDANTKAFMEAPISGQPRPAETADLIDPEILKAKNLVRDEILRASKTAASSDTRTKTLQDQKIEDLIDVKDLVLTGGKILKDLHDIDDWGMSHANVSDEVWSGSAWAQYRGHTAQRYNNAASRNASSWKEAWDLVSTAGRSFFEVATGQSRDVAPDDLSPAEKYDLLIGVTNENKEGQLAKYEWEQGRESLARYGSVPKWFGYCHGWAAASFMMPRPTTVVDAMAADGKTLVRFYPFDLKALETLLWANALPDLRSIGHRCEISNPARDASGHVIDSACFDVNPGLFHLALVNQLGAAQRNLIIDATYDKEIWNQPIISYSYRYFNPQTRKAGGSVNESTVGIKKFTKDKFRKYRAPEARAVVGVAMDIVYARGILPDHRLADSRLSDKRKKVTYLYDLELDDKAQIIGGEWYQLRHPDFIWTTDKNAVAESEAEKAVSDNWETWGSVQKPLPESWRSVAASSAEKGSPLRHVIDRLIQQSRAVSQ